ncbi:MAG TPA: hypothetical protein DEB06_11135, partial [Phycisphaerales bacterium]|nr:hypothetical protein [Phycisphaerales bacterium]
MNTPCWIKCTTTTALLTLAGIAAAQPIVDGKLDMADGYSGPFALQTSTVIDFEAAPRVLITAMSNQSNILGKGEFATAGTQSAPDESDPAGVASGVEIAIRLTDLPGQGVGVPGNTIKIAGFISGGSFASNQFIGGLDGDPENLGSLRNVNLEADHSGKQYLAISTATRSPIAPTLDGVRSMTEGYGPRAPQTNVGTGFGSNSVNPPAKNAANGSEINGAYGYIWDNATPGNPNDDVLVIFIAGNLEPNFNRLNLFIDSAAGGQNTITRTNSTQGFNSLIRWGENADGTSPQEPTDTGPGLTFDSDCSPDIWISINHGNGGPATTNAAREAFADSAVLLSNAAGPGTFFGPATIALTPGTPASGPLAGSMAMSADALRFEIDNRNSSGAGAVAPNNGGVGGRVSLPGGGSQMDDSAPASVVTGMEFKIPLDGAGWDGLTNQIKIAGIITGFNWDFMSNQAIGGLTSMSSPVPGNLGFPAKDVDFTQWDNNQFVTVTLPGVIPAGPAASAIDGSITGADSARYGAPLWTNATNASAFGNARNTMTPPFTVTADRANGSELNAVYAYVANDPANANKPTLYIMATGNLHDFNKLILFIDADPAQGQNDIRGDNASVGNFNAALGGPDGFTFDAGFTADYAIAYEIGFNSDTMMAEHSLYGLQLLTGGGGFGARAAQGTKAGQTPALQGEIIARVGFGSNDLTPTPVGQNPTFYDRSIRSNGSELNAVYMFEDDFDLYFFIPGNLEANLTSVEIFIDNIPGGQNTLIFDSRDSQDPLYTGNPNVDFGALNRMGGPVLDEMMMVTNEGLTFDTGVEPDFYFSFRAGDFAQSQDDPTPGVGSFNIFGNYARLRTLADPVGPLPASYSRFMGSVANDVIAADPTFQGGDQSEFAQAAIDNSNLGGVGGGRSFVCSDGTETNPASVTRGIEIRIDKADIDAAGPAPTPMKVVIFLNGFGHGNVSNQVLGSACVNDLGEPRDVDFSAIPANQFIAYPLALAQNPDCRQDGDANGDGFVDFDDITDVLSNWLDNYLPTPGTGPGDADGNGVVNFDDITTI